MVALELLKIVRKKGARLQKIRTAMRRKTRKILVATSMKTRKEMAVSDLITL
jgi:hypothetical protein